MLNPTLAALQRLVDVVAQLRSPQGGCPWDLAQTPQTLIPHIIEEAYETVAALQTGTQADICEELGDLLLQVVLQAQIASEFEHFNLAAIADGITTKLIRRHPHVFGDETATTVGEVRANWEAIKAAEKGNEAETISGQFRRSAQTLPPLMASLKISRKAAALGFEWETLEDVWGKVEEEWGELKEAIAHKNTAEQEAELGDLLFALIQIARWQGLDPSRALQGTNHRFIQRLEIMERVGDRPLTAYSLPELDQLWNEAKRQLGQGRFQPEHSPADHPDSDGTA